MVSMCHNESRNLSCIRLVKIETKMPGLMALENNNNFFCKKIRIH